MHPDDIMDFFANLNKWGVKKIVVENDSWYAIKKGLESMEQFCSYWIYANSGSFKALDVEVVKDSDADHDAQELQFL